jgi:HSP20 family protein
MKLVKHNRNELDQWFNHFYSDCSQNNDSFLNTPAKSFPIEINKDDTHFYASAEIPGVKKENVSIEIHDSILTINTERAVSNSREKETIKATRQVKLGENINVEAISAKLEDGILTLKLPLAEKVKPRSIEVN